MILCVSLNPAVDKMLKINSINIGKVNRASLESVHAGGKAVNVAFDLRLQGEDAFVTGFAGGKCGRIIIEELNQRKMPNRFIMLSSETRTNMNSSSLLASTRCPPSSISVTFPYESI